MIEDIIKVNLVCKLNSLMANLTISKDLVDRIKEAHENDELKEFSHFFGTSEEKRR